MQFTQPASLNLEPLGITTNYRWHCNICKLTGGTTVGNASIKLRNHVEREHSEEIPEETQIEYCLVDRHKGTDSDGTIMPISIWPLTKQEKTDSYPYCKEHAKDIYKWVYYDWNMLIQPEDQPRKGR